MLYLSQSARCFLRRAPLPLGKSELFVYTFRGEVVFPESSLLFYA